MLLVAVMLVPCGSVLILGSRRISRDQENKKK